MASRLPFTIDRSAKVTLAEQIRKGIADAIEKGVLVPGARLPSWRDLAAQLGVARGTVRTAYERLIDAQLIVASTPGGTRVAERPVMPRPVDVLENKSSFIRGVYREFSTAPAIFQMGVPGQSQLPRQAHRANRCAHRPRGRASRGQLSGSSRGARVATRALRST